ncbi:MAG: guanylate kinase [Firmicutes bacterium]|nr:guanylate kinase [Bacillota bacterium]
MTVNKKGILVVVSGPAGVGKGTVCDVVSKNNPEIFISISATTRAPRRGEVDGVHYYFKTKEQFEEMIENNELLEYNKFVNGNYYGTPAKECDTRLENGVNIILEIDVEGGKQVRAKRPDAVMIFVLPPSFCELEKRLRGRSSETEEDILSRLARSEAEFEYGKKYDYLIVNDMPEMAAAKIQAIIEAEKHRTFRCLNEVKKNIIR